MALCRRVYYFVTASPPRLRTVISQVLPFTNLNASRTFTRTSCVALKEIQVHSEDNVTTVEGVYVKSERKDRLMTIENPKGLCPLCPSKIGVKVKYTDVLVLSQFVRPDGCLLSRNVTGLCMKAQRRMALMVHRAQRAGLMPELRPDRHTGEERTLLKSPHKWRQYNIFYDE